MGLFSFLKKKKKEEPSLKDIHKDLEIPPPPKQDIETTMSMSSMSAPPKKSVLPKEPPHQKLPNLMPPKDLKVPSPEPESKPKPMPEFPTLPKLPKEAPEPPKPSLPDIADIPTISMPVKKPISPPKPKMDLDVKPEMVTPPKMFSRQTAKENQDHFVESEAYADIKDNADKVRITIAHAKELTARINKTHTKQKTKTNEFKKSIENMQKQFMYLDKALFER